MATVAAASQASKACSETAMEDGVIDVANGGDYLSAALRANDGVVPLFSQWHPFDCRCVFVLSGGSPAQHSQTGTDIARGAHQRHALQTFRPQRQHPARRPREGALRVRAGGGGVERAPSGGDAPSVDRAVLVREREPEGVLAGLGALAAHD